MDEAERRNNYRVQAPPGYLREVALWSGREVADGRLTLEQLGAPDALGLAGTGGIALTDVSTRGLRMRLSMETAHCLGLASEDALPGGLPTDGLSTDGLPTGGLHVYLKLLSPVVGAAVRNYTLFLGTRVTHVDHAPGAVLLGLHITSRGVPEKAEKAFRMFDAGRYGVKELTRWCDEVARMGRGLQPAPSPGLDLEHLLAEIDAARACGAMQANRN
ncbi:hypothetical protein [Nitratidesulfovibrio sp. SRB-5]|uniref:hypothetical protein n=1 Tax=Nitratidesulfovibrio sp. SRB-5 TaxID=2872636 RepID=UPI001CBA6585|nr:hypothetical protein [Nitratidesulfovibrio sp. SRB-5]